jgi:catechol 2,3-dioxygenase-like lactoylglutathione lyase family enzyme
MPEIKLSKIHAVMLGAKDLARSLEFYRDKLGMTVKDQSSNFVFLDGGGVTLMLSLPLHRASQPTAGAAEVVFSVEAVRPAYEALRQRGVEFFVEPRNVAGPYWAANFHDPDGHNLSVFGLEDNPQAE